MRIPYELVAVETEIILMKIITSDQLEYWWDYYHAYLEAVGWDDNDFDIETLRRIDESWDNITLN